MLFVIDVGNSHTVAALYDGSEIIGHWRLKTDPDRTGDELAIRYYSLFAMEKIDPKQIKHVVLASVVPTLEAAWLHCCEKHFSAHLESDVIRLDNNNMSSLISIGTDNPEEVGIDRLVNGYAAYNKFQTNLIVIDFGTAITFDCVTDDCTYIGGVILPGIAISLNALASKTAKLPMIDVTVTPETIIGKNTVHAMKSGILYGYGSMIDGIVLGIKKEMVGDNDNIKVVSTGGMAQLIAPVTKTIENIDPLLTLNGLQLIYNQLKKGQRVE